MEAERMAMGMVTASSTASRGRSFLVMGAVEKDIGDSTVALGDINHRPMLHASATMPAANQLLKFQEDVLAKTAPALEATAENPSPLEPKPKPHAALKRTATVAVATHTTDRQRHTAIRQSLALLASGGGKMTAEQSAKWKGKWKTAIKLVLKSVRATNMFLPSAAAKEKKEQLVHELEVNDGRKMIRDALNEHASEMMGESPLQSRRGFRKASRIGVVTGSDAAQRGGDGAAANPAAAPAGGPASPSRTPRGTNSPLEQHGVGFQWGSTDSVGLYQNCILIMEKKPKRRTEREVGVLLHMLEHVSRKAAEATGGGDSLDWLESITPETRFELARVLRMEKYNKDEYLFKQGEYVAVPALLLLLLLLLLFDRRRLTLFLLLPRYGSCFYITLSGSVQVLIKKIGLQFEVSRCVAFLSVTRPCLRLTLLVSLLCVSACLPQVRPRAGLRRPRADRDGAAGGVGGGVGEVGVRGHRPNRLRAGGAVGVQPGARREARVLLAAGVLPPPPGRPAGRAGDAVLEKEVREERAAVPGGRAPAHFLRAAVRRMSNPQVCDCAAAAAAPPPHSLLLLTLPLSGTTGSRT